MQEPKGVSRRRPQLRRSCPAPVLRLLRRVLGVDLAERPDLFLVFSCRRSRLARLNCFAVYRTRGAVRAGVTSNTKLRAVTRVCVK
jgi:hypothetical protein